ncbi:MAG: UDP-N-acetylmuramoyl-L-alanine--D-glutamate ligase [Xanthomonadales bacterium]|nr:UDP-N-acetylmuramoyl-L-alanine--D-glutamate ligase [Xanthomonadales bacterium]
MDFERLGRRKIAIWGYGREGQAALAVLRQRMPDKPLALILSEEEAAQWDFSVDPLLTIYTEEPSAGLLGQFQVIIKSPGISPYGELFDWARFRGSRFISGTQLWFTEHAQDRSICITGTKGKSTVSAMVAHLLRSAGQRTALAGNIGMPLLELLEPDPPPEWWVIELSSFQTVELGDAVPAVAAVLNLSPEHLDWHGDVERYYSDKLKILAGDRADVAVLNAADPELMKRTQHLERRILFNHGAGWHVADGWICDGSVQVLPCADLPLRGRHNQINAAAALAIVEACGLNARELAPHLASFKALPHRLQLVGEADGRRYVNDSIATTPAATLEALNAFAGEPVALLVGGHDRGLDWSEFARALSANPPAAVIGVGAHGGRIIDLLDQQPLGNCQLLRCPDLAGAVLAAQEVLSRGVILLSPGAPSFDAFSDYRARGRAFAAAAGFAEVELGEVEGLGIG